MRQFLALVQFFNDLPLAAVLAAYATADDWLSESECAVTTSLTRKTVRKKKRELIERGFLYREKGFTNGQADPCRIDRERLARIISTTGVILPRSEEPTGVILPRSNEPTRVILPRSNEPTRVDLPRSEAESGVILPRSEPPHKEERTHAGASLVLASYKDLASYPNEGQNEAENPLRAAVSETLARARLLQLKGKKLSETTLRTLCAALAPLASDERQVKGVLDVLETKARQIAKRPGDKGWGYVVNIVKGEVSERVPLPARKPPASEPSEEAAPLSTSQLFAEVKAKAAKMGSMR